MNAWIDTIIQLTGIGRGGMDVSLSDLSVLLPDTRWLLVVGVVAVFCLAAACQNACTDRRENKESHTDRR